MSDDVIICPSGLTICLKYEVGSRLRQLGNR